MSTGIVIVDHHDSNTRLPPPTTTTTDNNNDKNNGKILQKRWVCDVCKVKWFLDFKEACAHEAQCSGISATSSSSSSSMASSSEEAEPVNDMVGGGNNEHSLISADSNDGSTTSRSSSRRNNSSVLTKEGAAVLAAARARVLGKQHQQQGGNANPVAAVAATRGGKANQIVDLSDTEDDDGNVTTSPRSRRRRVGGGGGLAIIDESSILKEALEESVKESSHNDQSANNDAVSSSGRRRKSKRLRDAPSKPPPLKDSNTSNNNNMLSLSSNSMANGKKKAKKSKASKADNKLSKSSKKKMGAKSGGGGGQLASIFLSKKALPKAAPKKGSSASKEEEESAVPGVSKADYDEHVAAEKQQAAQRKKKKRSAADEKTNDPNNPKKKKEKQQMTLGKRNKKREVVDIESSSSSDEDDDGYSDDDVEYVADKPTKTKHGKSTTTNKKKKNVLSKEQLAEHQAADFFAKRKQQAAEERERQKKREELRLARLNEKMIGTNGGSGGGGGNSTLFVGGKSVSGEKNGMIRSTDAVSSSSSGKSTEDIMSSSSRPSCSDLSSEGKKRSGRGGEGIPAVRFPCPSHVVPEEDGEADWIEMETDAATMTGTSTSLDALRKTPRYPHLTPDMSPSDINEVVTLSTPFQYNNYDQRTSLEKNSMFDLLSSVFDQGGGRKEGSNKQESQSTSTTSEDNQLWVDKYSMSHIPNDILGTTNKEASKKLLSFVEEWKVRRHKSVQSMGQVKRSKKKRRRKKHGYDSDDSFLDDGDNGGLENIFLITGPTGSGKTRLVHAVAEQSDCVVIEINSSEVRSGQALKRAIQETTQSHSSLAMSKQQRGGKKGGGGANGIFDNGNNGDESLHDGDDEDSDCCSESDEESVRESHSLTIILIDEVDLLFDEDTAFWPALSQVSQKAKCPIVLTAASAPGEMKNFRCQGITLDCPPPEECGIKMAEVSKSEGMRFKNDVDLATNLKRLSLIAEACRCDIRKILNEMQLFQFGEAKRSSSNANIDMDLFGLQQKVDCPSLSSSVEDRPLILSVEPKLVPKDSHTLITITGENFSSSAFPSQCCILMGGEECLHFRVISESKILAVCPPCGLPEGVSESAVYENSFSKNLDCLTGVFVEVVVRKKCSNGLTLDSSSRIGLENNDLSANWNIEYNIPLRDSAWEQKWSRDDFIRKSKAQREARKKMASESDGFLSSEEEQFDKKPDPPALRNDQDQHDNDDETMEDVKEEVKNLDPQAMLDEAMAEMDSCEKLPSVEAVLPTQNSISLGKIDSFADELRQLSDAVLLEDSFTTLAIPSLTGSIEGFGSHAIESLSFTDPSIDKLCRGKNKKPPSFETIYSAGANESGFFFGNSDTYVTHPNRRRDRHLLSYSELHSRGLGFLDNCNLPEESSDNSKSEFNDEETDTSFLQLRTCVPSEDDILLNQQVSPSLLSLPSILEQGLGNARKHGFTRDLTPLLQIRRSQISTHALGIMHTAVANCNVWYHGLRHDDEKEAVQKIHVWLRDSVLDRPLSVDYLPCLRAIAHHENKVRRQVEEMMTENNDDMTRGRRRTRTSRKHIRRHYLDECAGGQDKTIAFESLKLAKNYMG